MNGEKKIFVGLLEKVVSFLHQGKPQFVKDADEGKFRQLRALRASLVAKKEELKKASPADRPAIKTAILKNKDELKLYNFFHWLDTEAERQRLTKLLTRSRELRADYLVQKAARAKDLRLLAPVKAAFMEKFASLKADHKAALKDIKALKALDNETAEKFEARKKAACAAEKASYEAKFEALNKESAAASLAAAPDARKHLFALETDKDALHLARVSFKQDLVDQDVILSVRHMKQFFDMGGGDKTKAVHDVSFDIKRNECFGLVGESGCGKTTTGRCIIKLYDITSGAVYYEGYRISGGPRFNLKEIKWSRIHAKEKTAKLKEKKKLEIASIPLKSLRNRSQNRRPERSRSRGDQGEIRSPGRRWRRFDQPQLRTITPSVGPNSRFSAKPPPAPKRSNGRRSNPFTMAKFRKSVKKRKSTSTSKRKSFVISSMTTSIPTVSASPMNCPPTPTWRTFRASRVTAS